MRPFANKAEALRRFVPLLLLPLIFLLCSSTVATSKSKPVKESRLAGLRPGIDTLENAFKRFSKKTMEGQGDYSWSDSCNGQHLILRANPSGPLWEVLVERIAEHGDCTPHSYSQQVGERWGSGHGLLIRDSCDRIEAIYGAPLSKNSSEVDLAHVETYHYYYRAEGENVALNWSVTCETAKDGSLSGITVMKLRVAGK